MSTRNSASTPPAAQARAFWVTGAGRGEIRAEQLREPTADDVRVRTLYSAISRGSETLVWMGRVPQSEQTRMRAPFQSGEFPWPVKYGYINVGQVEHGPVHLRGRVVFCLYPHQTRYVVPQTSVFLVPDTVPAERAVLAANLETALNGAWDAEISRGSRVSVIGGGAVGLLAAWVAHAQLGANVELIDTNPARARIAKTLGVAFAPPEHARSGAEIILHASGSAAGLRTALEIASFEATIIELSWYGDTEVALPLGAAFHSQRLTLRASQVGVVARSRRHYTTTRDRMEHGLALLAEPTLDALITGESKFDELPASMSSLMADAAATICHRISYDNAR